MAKDTSIQTLALNFIKNKNNENFSNLIKRLKPGLFSFVYNFVKDKDLANDVVSQTIILMWQKIDQYNHKYNFSTWVYAIAKNEEMFVERFCNSAKDADYIVIADTGSTDNTVELAKTFTPLVYNISVQPWRFDHARNVSLALVPADADICICLDLDEVMVDGWRGMVERAWKGATRLRYKFDWSNGVLFYSDKIHSRAGYSWIHPCHEVLKYNGTEQMATIHDLLIVHKPDNSKSRGSYLGLLVMAYKETPDDPRTMLYYGRELSFYNQHGEALQILRKYVDQDNPLHERAYACSLIGKAFLACGSPADAELYLLRGVYYDSHQRRGFCDLSEFY